MLGTGSVASSPLHSLHNTDPVRCHSGCQYVYANSNVVMSEGSKHANVKIFLFTTVSKNQGTLKIVRVGDNLQK